jgi:3'(2'), 5'-bisphosphate nucleotidase
VNIALIEGHAPVLGVVHVPVGDTTYHGIPGEGAWRQVGAAPAQALHVATRAADPVRVVGSRSHRGDSLEGFLARLGPHELKPVGSSLKFCMIAEGAADVYPRLGPTSEWDTAAAQAVVVAAGGAVVELDGQVHDPVELLVGTRLVAKGEVVVVDGNYGIRVTEIASPGERMASLNQ